jgi:hypothetical protein
MRCEGRVAIFPSLGLNADVRYERQVTTVPIPFQLSKLAHNLTPPRPWCAYGLPVSRSFCCLNHAYQPATIGQGLGRDVPRLLIASSTLRDVLPIRRRGEL